MSRTLSRRPFVASVLFVPCVLLVLSALFCRAAPDAAELLNTVGVKGGLVVCVGFEDAKLLSGVRTAGPFLVQGLHPDPAKVARVRKELIAEGLYGPVTVSRLEDGRLPYVDGLVNMVVISDRSSVISEEVERVLAPRGVLLSPLSLVADHRSLMTEASGLDGWAKLVNPVPDAIDDWPHYLYDPSNNAVSKDRVVAPPRGLRWTCGPEYARSHEHFGSVSAMVSAAGRVFYIIDEGPISSVFLPPKWKLVARDAFSGVPLWQRPMTNWEAPLRGFRSGPPEIGRRLITDGPRLYVTMGYGEAVSVLDAVTGKTIGTLAETEGATELLLEDGILYVLADDMTGADHDKRKQWINEQAPKLKGYGFPGIPIPMYGKQRILALEADGGKIRWQKTFDAAGEVMPVTLAVAEGRMCYQTGSHLVCLDAADGKDVWSSPRPVARSRFSWSTPTLVVADGVVLTVDRLAQANARKDPPPKGSVWIMDNSHQSKKQAAELVTFSLKDGKEMWRAPCFENYDTQLDIFVIDGTVWVGDLRHKRDAGFTGGRDLRTGKLVKSVVHNKELYDLQMGHHRCYRNRATERFLLLGRDGVEFVDPKTGKGDGNWWVRGTCQYGVMPANGLVYVPQHSCGCHPAEKLNGFNVLSGESGEYPASAKATAGKRVSSVGDALKKGPAYGTNPHPAVGDPQSDWPTYRADARRSGFRDVPAPRKPGVAWTARLAAPITPPVVAEGSVFLAETDRHTVHALSESDGKTAWTFMADGRIDSPPTIAGGLCLFGTRNGLVYCLRASDGELVWRFRAGPCDRRIFAYDQLESVWPVHGSVLVDEKLSGGRPVVYFAAGRSSHLDGGIRVYALGLADGGVLHEAVVTMAAAAEGDGIIKQRSLPDVLSVQKDTLWMRDLGLDGKLAPRPQKVPHLYAPGGFLDDTWWHRTYWVYGTTMMSGYGGWPRVGNMVPSGRLLAFDGGDTIYGYGRMSYRAGAGHVRPDATKGYKLFAEVLSPKRKPQPKAPAKGGKKRPPAQRREIKWSADLPFLARSVVLARDALVVAGGNTLTETAKEHGPGRLWVVAREDGRRLAACDLPAPAILDGAALAGSALYVSTIDGSLVCVRDGK